MPLIPPQAIFTFLYVAHLYNAMVIIGIALLDIMRYYADTTRSAAVQCSAVYKPTPKAIELVYFGVEQVILQSTISLSLALITILLCIYLAHVHPNKFK
jgi:hypothetical protein